MAKDQGDIKKIDEEKNVFSRHGGLVKTDSGYFAYVRTKFDHHGETIQEMGDSLAKGFTRDDCIAELIDVCADLHRYSRKLLDDIEEFKAKKEEFFDEVFYDDKIIYDHKTGQFDWSNI